MTWRRREARPGFPILPSFMGDDYPKRRPIVIPCAKSKGPGCRRRNRAPRRRSRSVVAAVLAVVAAVVAVVAVIVVALVVVTVIVVPVLPPAALRLAAVIAHFVIAA